MLPNDINMLVSFLNTKLRDDDMSLAQKLSRCLTMQDGILKEGA